MTEDQANSFSDQSLTAPSSAAAPGDSPGAAASGPTREPEYSHLDPRIVPHLQLPPEQRIRIILSDIVIVYPTFSDLVNEVSWLVEEPRRLRARGLVVQAVQGNGKSALAEHTQRLYPLNASRRGAEEAPRVVVISMSGARTIKAILDRILIAAQAPVGRGGTIGDLEQVVINALLKMNCRLLVIDEVQDLLGATRSEQVRVTEVIKNLMNTLRMPVLALGAKGADEAFRADPHLRARFTPKTLPQWKDGPELEHFLHAFERVLPLKRRSDLCRPEIQKLLVKATGGVLDPMMTMMRDAAVRAVVDGSERITKDSLSADIARPPVSVLFARKGG